MSRTILEIAQEAAERDATAPAPKGLFGTNDRIARILRQAAKDTLREYLRSSGWQGFSEFHSTWVFALQPRQYAYPLPPDFLRIIPGTEQRNGCPLNTIGPASPQTWARWIGGGMVTSTSSPMGWRIKNNALWIEPTPTEPELVTIEYISRYPVVSEMREGDFNLTLIPPQTLAPIIPRDGHLVLSESDRQIFAGSNDVTFADTPGYDFSVWPIDPLESLKRISPTSSTGITVQVRRPEITADSDRLVFDDDFALSLGLTFRLRRSLGLPFHEHAAEYDEELAIKAATDAGNARVFRLGDGEEAPRGQHPLGNGRWIVN